MYIRIGRLYIIASCPAWGGWQLLIKWDIDTSKHSHKTHCRFIEVKDDPNNDG